MGSDGKTGQQPKQERQRNVWHIDDVSEDVPAETHACPPCRKKFRHKFQLHRHALRKHDAWAAAPSIAAAAASPSSSWHASSTPLQLQTLQSLVFQYLGIYI